jgi:hypothetical protein
MTFRKLIQMYSQGVNSGYNDTDLTKRQRQYLHVLLNLAGNNYVGEVSYPPSDDVRRIIIQSMGNDASNVRWFLNPAQEQDFDAMISRAIETLRSI